MQDIQYQSQVDSLIPLLVKDLDSVQGAVDHSSGLIIQSVQALDEAEEILKERYGSDAKYKEMCQFIDGCKYACTANLNWRYVRSCTLFIRHCTSLETTSRPMSSTTVSYQFYL